MCLLFANTLERCNVSASLSKDVKTFFIKELCCDIANYTIQLVTTGKPVNSYLILWASYCSFFFGNFEMSFAVFLATSEVPE